MRIISYFNYYFSKLENYFKETKVRLDPEICPLFVPLR